MGFNAAQVTIEFRCEWWREFMLIFASMWLRNFDWPATTRSIRMAETRGVWWRIGSGRWRRLWVEGD